MVGVGFVAAPAEACMRDMPKLAKKKKQTDPTKRDVVAAEKALAKGDHAAAGTLARGAIPKIEELAPPDAAELATRAQRTLALAVVRSEGAVPVSPRLQGSTESDKQTNLAWAQLVLTYHAALKSDNIVIKVQLAESLSRNPYEKDRAREMLRDLSARDLMPTASGYALLASLESDTVLRDAATSRCRELGGTACTA
jgi:hypothetical protein